jgi:hypothetical protein
VVGEFVKKKQVIRNDSFTSSNANEAEHVLKVALNHESLFGWLKVNLHRENRHGSYS